MLESSHLKVHISGGASQKESTQRGDNTLKSGNQILSLTHTHTIKPELCLKVPT